MFSEPFKDSFQSENEFDILLAKNIAIINIQFINLIFKAY